MTRLDPVSLNDYAEVQDLSPEFGLVRQSLRSAELWGSVHGLDALLDVAVRATRADRHRWDNEVAIAHGATWKNPVDYPTEWSPEAVAALPAEERLAWLAAAVAQVATSYYGYGLCDTVAGHDVSAPGGLVRALLTMRAAAEEADGVAS